MLPRGFYMNEWTTLRPEAEAQFHATSDEIHRAAETRDQRLLRRQLRKQKNVLFKAILEVSSSHATGWLLKTEVSWGSSISIFNT